jgi:hypothetical protein
MYLISVLSIVHLANLFNSTIIEMHGDIFRISYSFTLYQIIRLIADIACLTKRLIRWKNHNNGLKRPGGRHHINIPIRINLECIPQRDDLS